MASFKNEQTELSSYHLYRSRREWQTTIHTSRPTLKECKAARDLLSRKLRKESLSMSEHRLVSWVKSI